MILVIDNYDSFVHNLARCLRVAGAETMVVRNDQIDVAGVIELAPQAVVIGPGPGGPADSGVSMAIARELIDDMPMMGVCLGLQVIGEALGARIVRAQEPMHGRTSQVKHDGSWLFEGIDDPFQACRYHSLALDPEDLPSTVRPIAWEESGVIMAAEGAEAPWCGVQFHPEAILTESGDRLLQNFVDRTRRGSSSLALQ